MADPVLKPLVDRGLGPNLQELKGMQRVGDGASSPGPGLAAARQMTGGGAQDAATAGGLKQDSGQKYAHLPEPMRGLLNRAIGDGSGPVV